MATKFQLLIVPIVFLLTFSQTSFAQDQDLLTCQKKFLTASGKPSNIQTMASLHAVILWTKRAKKIGPKYGEWHYARESQIKCRKRSDYHVCEARAKPCKPTESEEQDLQSE